MVHNCKEDGVMPPEFFQAIKDGKEIQVKTTIGWITVSDSDIEFRNSLDYRIKPSE